MNSGWSSIQACSFWLWLYLQPRSRPAVSLTVKCVTGAETPLKISSSEISTGEKGGRRGVLLPGQERRGARAVSPADDGSLWVSKRMSQCFQRPSLWPRGEKQSPGIFTPTAWKWVACLFHTKSKNQSPGLRTLRLVNFAELSIDFSSVYQKDCISNTRNQTRISQANSGWHLFCLRSQTTWTSLEFSSRRLALSSSSSVWLPAFVIPWNADASRTKATVKTSG